MPGTPTPWSVSSRACPFPVKCCWNGLIALRAQPIAERGLRMRCAPDVAPLAAAARRQVVVEHVPYPMCWYQLRVLSLLQHESAGASLPWSPSP